MHIRTPNYQRLNIKTMYHMAEYNQQSGCAFFSGLTGTKYFSKNLTVETFAPIAKLVYLIYQYLYLKTKSKYENID